MKKNRRSSTLAHRLCSLAANNAACLLSFMIPVLIMLGIFIINGVFPFGDGSFMHSDMYHQYVPFLSELLSKLRTHDSLHYSWNVGVGSNFLALYGYYMASPFNWLVALFPDQYLIEFMSYMVILKIGLCGGTFCWYLSKHFRTRSFALVPFAILYALSGYLAAYNWNVMWLDCIFLFPLIALGLEKLVSEGKFKLYVISLGLCILSNYYISIMVCIFLVLYFLLLLVCSRQKLRQAAATFLRFAGFSLLAGALAAVLLIPEFAAVHLTEFSDSNFPDELTFYFSLIDMIARHSINVAVETGLDHWPNIYCGVAVFLLVPLYLSNAKISLREKVARIGLLAFLLVSFSANMLNFIWHGLNYPNSLPCRQSFLYIFLLLTLCAEALLRIRECSMKALGISFCFSLGLVALFEKLVGDEEAYPVETFLLTAIFLCVYGLLLYYYRKGIRRRTALRTLAAFAIVIVGAEAAINMYNTSCSVTSRSNYLDNLDSYQALVDRTRQKDTDFYRFEKTSRVTKNDGTLVGYPTASLFSSTANGRVEAFYDKMGMSDSKVFYCFDGATPLSSALLSVRYMFSRSGEEDPSFYTLIDQEGDIYLYESKYTLPLGFMVDVVPEETSADVSEEESRSWMERFFSDITDTRTDVLEEVLAYDSGNPLELQNRMAYALGVSSPLFLGMGTETDGNATTIAVSESGHYYAYVGNTSVDSLKMESESESKTFSSLKYHYICDLGWHDAGDVISLSSEDASDLSLSAYLLDDSVMDEVISTLGRDTMTVDSYGSTHVRGHIETDRDGELILSIPYEPGWTVWVDGEKVTPGLFADTFLSLSLDAGSHTIELSYRPMGLVLGIFVSICALGILILCIFLKKKARAKGRLLPDMEAAPPIGSQASEHMQPSSASSMPEMPASEERRPQ